MSVQFLREMEDIKEKVLTMSAEVGELVHLAVKAVAERDVRLADRVVQSDEMIDQMDVDIEEDCLKVLALHQPVARDLRFLISVLKIISDLERVGDFATSIAKKAERLAAWEVCLVDDELDAEKRDAYDRIMARHREHPDEVSELLDLLAIARHLERIGDHCTNIAETVIYLTEGEIVRHKTDEAAGEIRERDANSPDR
jgi:phosphate transport system protein